MSEKKTSTPKQIPLHEVVLKVMYEANKERPANLTIGEVYQLVSDDSISEINVSDVLNWLAVQKQVERVSGKYSLDRYSFLEERAKDRGIHNQKKTKEGEETPLHEVILNLMYEANRDEPAKLTLDDVFWKVSDPKIQKALISDVLKWLLNQRRIEYLSGKYFLDRIEFQDQKKISEKQPAKRKPAEKPKEKKAPEKKPKIVIPQAAEVEKVERKTPKKEAPPKETSKKSPPSPAPKKVEKVKEPMKEVAVPVNEQPVQRKWRLPVMVAALICMLYVFYLLYALNGSLSLANNSRPSEQVQSELVSAKAKLNEISDKGSYNKDDIMFLQERIKSFNELTYNASEVTPKERANERSKSLLSRLVIALLVTFIFIFFLLFGFSIRGISRKS